MGCKNLVVGGGTGLGGSKGVGGSSIRGGGGVMYVGRGDGVAGI